MDLAYKAIIVAVVVAAGVGFAVKIRHDIYQDGYKACAAEYMAAQTKANEKIVATKKVIKHETSSLDRTAIVRQLCANGWMRDKADCPAK